MNKKETFVQKLLSQNNLLDSEIDLISKNSEKIVYQKVQTRIIFEKIADWISLLFISFSLFVFFGLYIVNTQIHSKIKIINYIDETTVDIQNEDVEAIPFKTIEMEINELTSLYAY